MELKITIPTSLNEITLEQYQRFISIAENNPDTTFLQQKIIEIFCNVPLIYVADMTFKDVMEITSKITSLFETKIYFNPIIKLKDTNFGFIPDFAKITLGEFSDLDNYLGKWELMHKAIAVLFRPITDKSKEQYQIKEYNGTAETADLMLKMPLDVVLGSTSHYIEFKKNIINSFPTLFEETEQQYDSYSQFGGKWGWYSSFYALANGNVLLFDEISKLPLASALTFLSFEKEKNKLEQQTLQKNE